MIAAIYARKEKRRVGGSKPGLREPEQGGSNADEHSGRITIG